MDDTIISVTINTNGIEKFFNTLLLQSFKRELADAMDHISRKFYKRLLNERLSGPPGLTAHQGGLFHRFRRSVIMGSGVGKTIDLRASQSETTSTIADNTKNVLDMRVEMYTKSKVAGIYEKGGTISSGKGTMRIPLSDEAKQRKSNDPIEGLKVVQNIKTHNMFLVEQFGKNRLIFHYILKHSVPVNRRLGFYDLWDSMEDYRMDQLINAVSGAIAKA